MELAGGGTTLSDNGEEDMGWDEIETWDASRVNGS